MAGSKVVNESQSGGFVFAGDVVEDAGEGAAVERGIEGKRGEGCTR
jgi:hypothetical protein